MILHFLFTLTSNTLTEPLPKSFFKLRITEKTACCYISLFSLRDTCLHRYTGHVRRFSWLLVYLTSAFLVQTECAICEFIFLIFDIMLKFYELMGRNKEFVTL